MSFLFFIIFSMTRLQADDDFCKNDLNLIKQKISTVQTRDITQLKDYDFLQSRILIQKESIKNSATIDYVYFLKTSHNYRNIYSHFVQLKKDEKDINALVAQYNSDNCQETTFGNILGAIGTLRGIFYFGVKVKNLQKTLSEQSKYTSRPLTAEQVVYLLPNANLPKD